MIEIHNDIETIASDWASAELRGDVVELASILSEDFVGVGPLGFLLTKPEWLARHQSGDLTYEALDLDDMTVRVYEGAAILIGHQLQSGAYRGNRVDASFRTTLVFVRQEGRWRLAGSHLSPIGQPPAFARN
jgi:ketosteroid isomerase-like protein